MTAEVMQLLNCKPGGIYIDGTLGGGGYAAAICRAIGDDGCLIGIDQDPAAIANAHDRLSTYRNQKYIVHDNFAHVPAILQQLNISAADGIVLDLGMSFNQLENSERGFSFKYDQPLDMRMDPNTALTAADLVNTCSESELSHIFFSFGQEPMARRIARQIVKTRQRHPITSSLMLAQLISDLSGGFGKKKRLHPATRAFMALRIAVNAELDRLQTFLDGVLNCLDAGGRLCIVAFHSLEDRIVKRQFKTWATGCICPPDLPRCGCGRQPQASLLTGKPVMPTDREISANPMARSARLRAVEKTPCV